MEKENYNTFNIYNVITELSKTNPIFHNEQGFQDCLAHKIGVLYPNLKIKFEHKTELEEGCKSYIDILIKNGDGLYIPIELKYRTNKLSCKFDDCIYELSNQSAEDITRYGYLKDISRIEKYSQLEEKFLVGYAIMLTNQSSVWKENYNTGNTFDNYLINKNIIVSAGIKKWSENTSNSNKQNYPSFKLEQSYPINWYDYSNFNCKNGNFKIIITEITKKNKTNNSQQPKVILIKKNVLQKENGNTILTNNKDSNSEILNEIEKYLSNIPLGTIIETGVFRRQLSEIYNRPKDNYIPTDYCYNRYNDGINFKKQPKFFIYVKRGQVKYVGKQYQYTGPIYHKPINSKFEKEVGYCQNGNYKFHF